MCACLSLVFFVTASDCQTSAMQTVELKPEPPMYGHGYISWLVVITVGKRKKKKHLEKRDVVIHGSVFFSLSLFLAFEAFRCVLIRWFWRHSCFYSVFVRRMGSLIVKADFQYSHRAPTCEHKKKQTSIKLCQESSLTIIHLHSLRCSPSAKQP